MPTRPPRSRTEHELLFERLSPRDFERLCLALVAEEGYVDVQHIGAAGSDGGVDISARRGGRRIALQCKRVRAFGPAAARAAVEKVLDLRQDDPPDEIILVATCDIGDRARHEAVAAAPNLSVLCWGLTDLDRLVHRHPRLLEQYFGLPAPVGGHRDGERVQNSDLLEESIQIMPERERARRRGLLTGIGISLLSMVLMLALWLLLPSAEPPAPPPQPALYSVRVQVFDPQGRPVEGATVRASAGNEPQRLPDGWWEVEIPAVKVPADGRISLWAEHKEWEGNRTDLRLGKDANPRAEIRLKPPRTGFRGRVADSDDRGVPGVRVASRDGKPGEATTGEDGRFETPLQTLTVVVLDETGEPIAGAQIVADEVAFVTDTNSQGRATIKVPPGLEELHVTISKSGYSPFHDKLDVYPGALPRIQLHPLRGGAEGRQ